MIKQKEGFSPNKIKCKWVFEYDYEFLIVLDNRVWNLWASMNRINLCQR